MSKILLIDDDASLLDILSLSFEDEGYSVATAADGRQGYDSIGTDKPDLVVCDVNMPKLDGFALCRKLRDEGDLTPLILLTSRDSEIDETLGLDLGADDYISKPFNTRVLLARVEALLRRERLRSGAMQQSSRFQLGALTIDPDRLEVLYSGRPISVTVTEFRLIEALARRAGIVLSRDRLMELIRGDDSVVAERIVDTYVRRLRRKFEAIREDFDEIETVIGAGYRWRSHA